VTAKRLAWPRLLCGVAAIAWLPACGSGDIVPPPPATPTPTPLPPFVIFQAAFPPLDVGHFVLADFTIGDRGTVRATMDWTFPSNRMYLFIMAGLTCTDQDFITYLRTGTAATCTVLGSDEDPNTKPASITFNVTQPTGARVFVLNLGPTGESGFVNITLQR
jgi:hypothetical protein